MFIKEENFLGILTGIRTLAAEDYTSPEFENLFKLNPQLDQIVFDDTHLDPKRTHLRQKPTRS